MVPAGTTPAAGFLARLDAVEQRLADLAAGPPPAALTDPDPQTGERWEALQVWGHLAELVPFWREQARRIAAARSADPVPFGRQPGDPSRRQGIERYRGAAPDAPWASLRADLAGLRQLIAGLGPEEWRARGHHPTRGVLTLEQIVESFLIAHLEEHAADLERLARAAG